MPPQPDRALRRLVAELANATPDDIEAVLSALDDRHREKIEALLSAYDGRTTAPAPAPRHSANLAGLSSWLAVRVALPEGFQPLDGARFSMTRAARETLSDCAAALSAPALQPVAAADPPGWMRQVARTLLGRGATA